MWIMFTDSIDRFLFRCEPNYGVFVPAGKVSKAGRAYRPVDTEPVRKNSSKNIVNHGKVRKLWILY